MLGLLHQLQIAEESRGPGCRAVCREFSDAWKIALEDLKSRVQANAEIGRYPRLSNPQVFDLFDTYQAFRRVMDGVDRLNFVADFDGTQSGAIRRGLQHVVKITGWFGDVVRETIQDAGKCSEHRGFGACTNALQTRSGPGPAKCSVSLAVWSADKELIRAAKW
jgi:hypothetical protein